MGANQVDLLDTPVSTCPKGERGKLTVFFGSSPMNLCVSSYKNSSKPVDLFSLDCRLLLLAAGVQTLFQRAAVALPGTLSPI